MRVEQRRWSARTGWSVARTRDDFSSPQLVLVFGAHAALRDTRALSELSQLYPGSRMVGCSTAGEICDTSVMDDSMVATAIQLERSAIEVIARALPAASASLQVAEEMAAELPREGLAHAFVLVEGVHVNGSEFVTGLRRRLPEGVAVTGGLAGDGDRFGHTLVCVDGKLHERMAVMVGWYGPSLRVGYGSMGGWDHFGPERIITRATGNVLHELDGEPALDLYRRYLGPAAAGLPASGLRFPLSVQPARGTEWVVRTILGIDDEARSLIYAGDVPQGSRARLMKANTDRIIDGATEAATRCHETLGSASPDLALLISCVGRRIVLGQRTEEELDSVREVLGATAPLAGFYSYGEIAPFMKTARCELHNQTMTITTFSER